MNELGRLSSIGKTARLVAALVTGKELTRGEVRSLTGLASAAADRQIAAIARHLPLVKERRRGKAYVRLDRSKLLGARERVPISTTIAACVGASLARLFEGTSYEQGMHDLLQYVARDAVNPDRIRDARRQFVFLSRGGEKALPENEVLLSECVDALQRKRALRIRYRGFNGKLRWLRIEPLSLALYDHQLYLIGRPKGGAAHPFRFSRIEAADTDGGTFQYPDKDSYDPERVFAHSFGIAVEEKYPIHDIELSLAGTWQSFVKSHRWHRSQESVVKNGRVHVKLRVRLCPEVIAWVLGFGPDVRVVEPRVLRERIAKLALQMAKVHKIAS
jgi:hypothetical protein